MTKPESSQNYSDEVKALLPACISEIQPQKKNTFRFSVFIEDRFLLGVSDHTLCQFNLAKGVEITPVLYNDIMHEEYKWKIREYFIMLLSRRDHSKKELAQKAFLKGYPATETEIILDDLKEKGYINDLAFAKKFVKDKFRFNKWGTTKLKNELIRKGITDSDINDALKEISGEEVIEQIEMLVQKNRLKFLRTESSKRKKKIFDFLLRKGYDSDVVLKHLDRLNNKIEV